MKFNFGLTPYRKAAKPRSQADTWMKKSPSISKYDQANKYPKVHNINKCLSSNLIQVQVVTYYKC